MTLNTNTTTTVCGTGRTSLPKARAHHPFARAFAAASLACATAIAPVITGSLIASAGFDPLGLVITGLAQTPQQPLNPVGGQPGGPPVTPKPGGPLTPTATTYKIDAIEFLLRPDQFVEYKFNLKTGETMMFNWTASGPLDVDFHTVPDGKPISASETFLRGTFKSGQGFYRAPYPGLHGWYWLNKGPDEVKIVLNASGFFTEARMFSGDPVGEPMEVRDPAPPE
ncbi:MAG: hypothetical protein HOP16_10260 [Acidobacteria bacterium]|nr:hypothetical protein [Acidobacteriota bacterium]